MGESPNNRAFNSQYESETSGVDGLVDSIRHLLLSHIHMNIFSSSLSHCTIIYYASVFLTDIHNIY